MSVERLQKIIAKAGIAARRKAEQIITEGRVRVNGQIVSELGAKADAYRDKIEVDGKPLRMPKASTYVVMNKPPGIVTTASDEFGRKTVLELVEGVPARLFPVGRLDYDAEGVLLLTDDGELAAALTHPSSQVPKTYRAKIRGIMPEEALGKLRAGVPLEDGMAIGTEVHRVPARVAAGTTWNELTITEGRHHMVKRMFDAVGHPVIKLKRVAFAGLTADDLRPGQWRHLRKDELRQLKSIAKRAREKRRGP